MKPEPIALLGLVTVFGFGAGVLVRDVAQDYRPPTFAECVRADPAPPVEVATPVPIESQLQLICEHYRATGRGHHCRAVET